MCVAIPMKVISVRGDTVTAEAGGVRREANVALLTSVKKGDYVLIHAGFAIEKVKQAEAKKTLTLLRHL